MYSEPDWSSLTLPELLEKALEFGNKAYSGSLSAYAFLERACDPILLNWPEQPGDEGHTPKGV